MSTTAIQALPRQIMQLTARAIGQQASERITDISWLLLELITNSDDIYAVLGVQRDVWIEIIYKKENSIIIYKDNGSGLTYEEQLQKLNRYGAHTSAEGVRGFFSVGAKDIIPHVNDFVIVSFKDGQYYRSKYFIESNGSYSLFPVDDDNNKIHNTEGRPASKKDYESFDFKPGMNGLIFILDGIRLNLPRYKNLCALLSELPQLRLIMMNRSSHGIKKIVVSCRDESQELNYEEPKGELLFSRVITSNIMKDAKIKLVVFQSHKPLIDGDYYPRNGFIVTAGRMAIEHTYFDHAFKNCQATQYVYGELRIPYDLVRGLLVEYDVIEREKSKRPIHNDRCLLRPTRKEGLDKNHPFVKDLFEQVRLILMDEVVGEQGDGELPKEFIDEFMRLAMEECQDEGDEEDGEYDDDFLTKALGQDGVYIMPQNIKMFKDSVRRLSIYVNNDLITDKKDQKVIKLEMEQDKNLIIAKRRPNDPTRGPREMTQKINLPVRQMGKRFGAQVDIISRSLIGTTKLTASFEDAYKNETTVEIDNYKVIGLMQFFRPQFSVKVGHGKRISLDINADELDLKQIKQVKLSMEPKGLVTIEHGGKPVYNDVKKCYEYWVSVTAKAVGKVNLTAELQYGLMKRKGESTKKAQVECAVNVYPAQQVTPAKIEIDKSETSSMFEWVPNTKIPTLKVYIGNKSVKKIINDPVLYKNLIILPAFASRNAIKTIGKVEGVEEYSHEYQAEMTRFLRRGLK
jgi:hypothetical protein